MTLNDAQRRALRTAVQALTGAGLVGFLELFVLPLFPTAPRLSPEQRTVLVTVCGTLVALCQNLLEDANVVPTLAKTPAA